MTFSKINKTKKDVSQEIIKHVFQKYFQQWQNHYLRTGLLHSKLYETASNSFCLVYYNQFMVSHCT